MTAELMALSLTCACHAAGGTHQQRRTQILLPCTLGWLPECINLRGVTSSIWQAQGLPLFVHCVANSPRGCPFGGRMNPGLPLCLSVSAAHCMCLLSSTWPVAYADLELVRLFGLHQTCVKLCLPPEVYASSWPHLHPDPPQLLCSLAGV